jgi:hypothetical protein
VRIKNQKDFYCGLVYILSGLGFSIVSSTYKMGTANRMGPGYFPFWLGILLTILGTLVSIGSLSPKTDENRLASWDFKSILWVLGSVVLFGLLLNLLGLVLSLVLIVFVSSKASHEFNWWGTGLNAIVMVAISMALFVYGLNLQVKVWPAFIGG